MASIPLLRPCFLHTLKPSSTTPTHTTLSLRPTSFSPLPITPIISNSRRQNAVVLTRMSNHPSSPPATDRLISIAGYTLPFFNSLQYGRYILSQYPNLALLFDPILPLLSLYRSIPYSSFVAFFALYLGLVRNPSFPHYVRFNAMQAVTLDILLVLPLLLQRIFSPGRSGIGFRVMLWSHNALFLFSVVCFVYSVVNCVLGRTPYLPFVADAASRQI